MGTRVAILAAEFNRTLVDAMVAAAEAEIAAQGAKVSRSLRVTGCYELPLLAQALLARADDFDAMVVLGCIERGETLHGEVMGHVVHRALIELALTHQKPIGLGIIGPGATAAQAEVRKVLSAQAAVRAALSSLCALRSL
jgi:6,7-dimethyl-8-ribityllumazine synthase